jgi:hypothetical protein
MSLQLKSIMPILRRASRRTDYTPTQTQHSAGDANRQRSLLFQAAEHLAQSRLLILRAIPSLRSRDVVALKSLSNSIHALILLLEKRGRLAHD